MILYEDSEIIVCHKPAGVPVQSASVRVKDMVSILKNQTGGEIYVVHRLDQPVEGVLVFAKTKKAAADLSKQVNDGSMKKIYHAVVELPEHECLKNGKGKSPIPGERIESNGNHSVTADGLTDSSKRKGSSPGENKPQTPGEWHTLVDYLVKDARENRSFVVNDNESGSKRAELRYRILRTWPDHEIVEKADEKPADLDCCNTLSANDQKSADTDDRRKAVRALVEIDLKTGRHHQIRVQMAHAGMPLVGDRKYNPKYNHTCKLKSDSNACGIPTADDEKNLALCAVSLTFRHPATKKRMTYEIQPQFQNLTE